MKWIAALLALLYSVNATPEQTETEWWQEYVLGAPCSLATDFENGECLNFAVLKKPRIRKNEVRHPKNHARSH